MVNLPERLALAQLPTPLERHDRLSEAWGGPTIWVKRDDLTGFGLSGNKVRKLEYHLAAARQSGADTVITCGAAQSNHARATAIAAAREGFRSVLVLRTPDGEAAEPVGNHLLHRLVADRIAYIDPAAYAERDRVMADLASAEAAAGHQAWVIPEGASDALGMWGFVTAMRELAQQLTAIPASTPPAIWHAGSSGGTTAGLAWGADRLGLATPIVACSVGDPADELRARVEAVWAEAIATHGATRPALTVEILDEYVGGGYGIASAAELAVQAEATALTGLLFDPTYTGKAIFGLRREIERGRWSVDDHVVFWHTGGGFALFAHDFGAVLT